MENFDTNLQVGLAGDLECNVKGWGIQMQQRDPLFTCRGIHSTSILGLHVQPIGSTQY